MAGTAQISSSFVISYTGTNTAASTIANPGRAFRIVAVYANNETGGSLNVTLTDGTNNITQGGALAVAANTAKVLEIDETHCDIGSAENLVCTVSGVGVVVKILCVATGGGFGLTVT